MSSAPEGPALGQSVREDSAGARDQNYVPGRNATNHDATNHDATNDIETRDIVTHDDAPDGGASNANAADGGPTDDRASDENVRTDDYTADSSNTVREHAGEALEDVRNWPGYFCIAAALAALGLTLTAGAYGFAGWVWIGSIAAVVLFAVGLTIVLLERKRVNAREGRKLTESGVH